MNLVALRHVGVEILFNPPRATASLAATFTSSLCSNERLSRLVVPITAQRSSTSSVFTWVMPGLILEDAEPALQQASIACGGWPGAASR